MNPIHWQFSVDKSNNIFFSRYYSEYKDGDYKKSILIKELIDDKDVSPGCPFISPDGDYLLFTSRKEGNVDIFISFKKEDGKWTKAINLGPKINTPYTENCPIVSPDGKYFFFLRMADDMEGVYWVDAKVIVDLKSKNLK